MPNIVAVVVKRPIVAVPTNAASVVSLTLSSINHAGARDVRQTIYKLDLVKQAFESSVPAPVSLLLCDQVSDLLCALFRDEVLDPPYVIPPPKTSSRHYLALYSTLLI